MAAEYRLRPWEGSSCRATPRSLPRWLAGPPTRRGGSTANRCTTRRRLSPTQNSSPNSSASWASRAGVAPGPLPAGRRRRLRARFRALRGQGAGTTSPTSRSPSPNSIATRSTPRRRRWDAPRLARGDAADLRVGVLLPRLHRLLRRGLLGLHVRQRRPTGILPPRRPHLPGLDRPGRMAWMSRRGVLPARSRAAAAPAGRYRTTARQGGSTPSGTRDSLRRHGHLFRFLTPFRFDLQTQTPAATARATLRSQCLARLLGSR